MLLMLLSEDDISNSINSGMWQLQVIADMSRWKSHSPWNYVKWLTTASIRLRLWLWHETSSRKDGNLNLFQWMRLIEFYLVSSSIISTAWQEGRCARYLEFSIRTQFARCPSHPISMNNQLRSSSARFVLPFLTEHLFIPFRFKP